MLQQFDFNGSRMVNTKGDFFRYQVGNAAGQDAAIVLRVDNVPVGKYSPGDLVKFPDPHSSWSIDPVTAGCIGTVVIGFGSVESQTLQGVVQTVDGGKSRSMAGSAFSGYAYQGGGAGNYAYVQLWNASADKNLIVNGVIGVCNQTNGFNLAHTTTAAASAQFFGPAKRSGRPASLAGQVRIESQASSSGLGAGARLALVLMPATTSQTYRPTEPIVIGPGGGIAAIGSVPGADLGMTFEWFEEAA